MNILIRDELDSDRVAVRRVNERAFERSAEADLVESLHAAGAASVALVAELDGAVIGHILFSPVSLTQEPAPRVAGLAPMAVAPAYQRAGVGSLLVREGLSRCVETGFEGVVVLGHPDYYPKFGFVPASRFELSCEYDVPDEAFMAVELERGALGGVSGLVRYHPLFAAV